LTPGLKSEKYLCRDLWTFGFAGLGFFVVAFRCEPGAALPANRSAAPGAEIALPDPLLSGEQPWWIVSDDPALFGSNLGDLVDADQ
jgi:hypothetical protein